MSVSTLNVAAPGPDLFARGMPSLDRGATDRAEWTDRFEEAGRFEGTDGTGQGIQGAGGWFFGRDCK